MFRETGRLFKEAALRSKEIDRRMAETDRKISKLGGRIGELIENLEASKLLKKFTDRGFLLPGAGTYAAWDGGVTGVKKPVVARGLRVTRPAKKPPPLRSDPRGRAAPLRGLSKRRLLVSPYHPNQAPAQEFVALRA